MHWFKFKKSALIGVDIGSRYIKLLEISLANGGASVTQFGLAELPMQVLTEHHEIKNPATISSSLLQLFASTKFHTKLAAIAVSGDIVVSKEIDLPVALDEYEMEEQAWLEAGKHFPDLINDLTLDFYVKENVNLEEKNVCRVMLVACRKTAIQNIIDALKGANLQVEIADVNYYALARILGWYVSEQKLPASETYALFNFNAYTSTFIVVKDNQLVYFYDHAFDEHAILKQLQEGLQWDNVLFHSQSSDDVTLDQIKASAAVEELVFHVNYALSLFLSSKEKTEINRLFVSGDSALIPHIDKCIEESVKIPTNIASPTNCVSISPGVNADSLKKIGPALMLSYGLALHEGCL